VLCDAMLAFCCCAIPPAPDSPQDVNALVDALARSPRCSLRPLSDTAPRFTSSTPASQLRLIRE